MKLILRLCFLFFCLLSLILPALADETEEDYGKDAQSAEGMPPTAPHRIEANATGELCLTCHRDGLKGAPATPHPERLDCTGCHVQGEIKQKAEKKRHDKKRK